MSGGDDETLVLSVPPMDREAAVKAFLASLEGQGAFPAFAENVRAVSATSKSQESSTAVLAEIVLRDVALTAKVLGVANSVSYNRSPDVIVDVSYAILMMGFDRVRDLALAATLLDHFKRASGLRELLAKAVLVANHSQEVARRVGYPAIEEAYLAGMFHSLGEIVVACHRNEEYRAVLTRVVESDGTIDREAAAREVFGLTFEEISVAVGERLRLPGNIVASMTGPPASLDPAGGVVPRGQAGLLASLTALSQAMVGASFGEAADQSDAALHLVWRDRGRSLNLSEEDLRQTGRAALTDTRDILRLLKIPLGDLLPRGDAAVTKEAGSPMPGRSSSTRESGPGNGSTGRLAALATTVRELRDLEGKGLPQQIASLVLRGLEAICEAGYQRSLFALANDERTAIEGRLCFGEGGVELRNEFSFDLSLNNPIGASLLRQIDLVVPIGRAGPIRHDRLIKSLRPRSLGLLPLVVNRVLIGCLYFDHQTAEFAVDSRLTELLLDLRDTLVRQLHR